MNVNGLSFQCLTQYCIPCPSGSVTGESAGRCSSNATQKVSNTLEQRHRKAVKMSVRRLSMNQAEVTEEFRKFEVDLSLKRCQCQVFQKDRIPCAHALAAADFLKISSSSLLDPLYLNSTLKELYKDVIHLVPTSRSQWTIPPRVQCLHPLWKRGPGRPQVHRYRSFWEGKKTSWKSKRCSECGRYGHVTSQCRCR